MNINAVRTVVGAAVTKNARTLRIAPAVPVGTGQVVFQRLPVLSIGENQMCFITVPAIILVILGFATKEAVGCVPARLP